MGMINTPRVARIFLLGFENYLYPSYRDHVKMTHNFLLSGTNLAQLFSKKSWVSKNSMDPKHDLEEDDSGLFLVGIPATFEDKAIIHRRLYRQGLNFKSGSFLTSQVDTFLQSKNRNSRWVRSLLVTENPIFPKANSNRSMFVNRLEMSAISNEPPDFSVLFASARYFGQLVPIRERQKTAMSTLPSGSGTLDMSHTVTCSLLATKSNE